MRKLLFIVPSILVAAGLFLYMFGDSNSGNTEQASKKFKKNAPGDYFFYQRSFPLGDIPYESFS